MADSHTAPNLQPGSGLPSPSNPSAFPLHHFVYLAGRLARLVKLLLEPEYAWIIGLGGAQIRVDAQRLAGVLDDAAAHVAASEPAEAGTLLPAQQERELCQLLFDAQRLAQAHVRQVDPDLDLVGCDLCHQWLNRETGEGHAADCLAAAVLNRLRRLEAAGPDRPRLRGQDAVYGERSQADGVSSVEECSLTGCAHGGDARRMRPLVNSFDESLTAAGRAEEEDFPGQSFDTAVRR